MSCVQLDGSHTRCRQKGGWLDEYKGLIMRYEL